MLFLCKLKAFPKLRELIIPTASFWTQMIILSVSGKCFFAKSREECGLGSLISVSQMPLFTWITGPQLWLNPLYVSLRDFSTKLLPSEPSKKTTGRKLLGPQSQRDDLILGRCRAWDLTNVLPRVVWTHRCGEVEQIVTAGCKFSAEL